MTPYIFEHQAALYFDTSMTTYYVTTLNLKYSKAEIKNELKRSLDSLKYKSSIRRATESSAKFMNVDCALKIFDTELELAGFETLIRNENELPLFTTKAYFITSFKELEIYKRLQN